MASILILVGASRGHGTELEQSYVARNTDLVVAGVGGLRNTGSGQVALSGVSGPVSAALLYWHGPTISEDAAVNSRLSLNSVPISGDHIAFSGDNCWGYLNSQTYVADVTSIVAETGDGAYSVSGLGAGVPANSSGASLVVFFDDGDPSNNRDVIVLHGNDANDDNPYDGPGWTATVKGITYESGVALLQLHVADGQSQLDQQTYDDSALTMNGSTIAPLGAIFSGDSVPADNNGPLGNGNLWDIKDYDITSALAPGENTLDLATGLENDCLSLVVLLANLPTGSAPPPDDEPPGDEPTGGRAPGCASSVGEPVSISTGNVFLDHTDASVPGIGAGLRFVRSYNSQADRPGWHGAFGRGWNHSYERRLSISTVLGDPTHGIIKLREPNGTPSYFSDPDGDSLYLPWSAATATSQITKTAAGYIHSFRQGGQETYDTSGNLTSIIDKAGNTVNLSYDGAGRLTAIAEPGGRTLVFGYEGASYQPTTLTGSLGLVATYGYDERGLLSTVSYADVDGQPGGGYIFGYDARYHLTEVKDLNGRILEAHSYYLDGRAATSELADGVERLTLVYGDTSTTVTDALGTATTYEYTRIRGVPYTTKVTGPCDCGPGETQEWSYDAQGRLLSYMNGLGATTTYGYYASGDLEYEEDALANRTTYTYDAEGRLLTRAGAAGELTTFTHGALGVLTATEAVSATTSRTTTFTYTPEGKAQSVTDARGKTTSFAYDPVTFDLASVTDPLNQTTSFSYDAYGRPTSVTDALLHTTTTTYDALSRVSRVTQHDETFTEFTYDRSGRRTKVTDPLGLETRYAYDDYGRLAAVLDPQGGSTRYRYDVMSRLTSLTDAEGRTTSFEYDPHGRIKKTIYPGGAEEVFTYDSVGQLATRTDRNGIVTTYTYDDLNQLTGKSYSDGITLPASYTYDTAGRLLTASNGTDTLNWTYDLAGQLVSEASAKNNAAVAYTYDLGGNRLSVSLDGQLFASYAYDDAARLESITRASSVFGFGYDEVNRRTSMTYPNGVTTIYEYDDLSRLTRLVASKGATPITDFGYAYDAAGNRTSKSTLDHTENYGYDQLYQLNKTTRTGVGANTWNYSYDKVGNRLNEQLGSSVISSTHNEKNQLLSRSVGGPMLWRGSLDEPGSVTLSSITVNGKPARMLEGNVFEATLDADPGINQVTVEATDVSGNVRTQVYEVDVTGTGATYSYDANGNLDTKVEDGSTWVYEWSAENQLTRVTKDSVEVTRFAYDPAGRRVEKVASGVMTSYAYDGADILRETSSAGTTYKYVHGPGIDEPLARDNAGTLTYYHADGLGSVVSMTDAAGAVTSTRRYDAWGNLQVGATDAGYAFTGREWDPETGLYYYRARYYDARAGRFISEDPINFRGGVNFFGYVHGNPVRAVDPFGLLSSRITYDVAHDYGIPFSGATEVHDVWVSTVAKSCKELPCGKYELEFTAKATVVMRTGPGCREATRAHESKHARYIAAKINAWFSQLAQFEGVYDSFAECEQAWRGAMTMLGRTKPRPSGAGQKFAHFFQYVPCF